MLDTHGALLDQVTAPLDDPAEKFACSFRLTGRLFRRRPQESLVLLSHGLTLISSDRGLAPRALAVAGGALMGLGQLLQDEPLRDDALAADQLTEDVLRLFGIPVEEAHEICQRPLPDIDALTLPDSAA